MPSLTKLVRIQCTSLVKVDPSICPKDVLPEGKGFKYLKDSQNPNVILFYRDLLYLENAVIKEQIYEKEKNFIERVLASKNFSAKLDFCAISIKETILLPTEKIIPNREAVCLEAYFNEDLEEI